MIVAGISGTVVVVVIGEGAECAGCVIDRMHDVRDRKKPASFVHVFEKLR